MTRDEVAGLTVEALRTLGHEVRDTPPDDAPWAWPGELLTVLHLVAGSAETAEAGYVLLTAKTFGEVVDAIAPLFEERAPITSTAADADEETEDA